MFLSLKSIELSGFKSFGKKTELLGFAYCRLVGPNGSGKSNVAGVSLCFGDSREINAFQKAKTI